MGAGGGGGGGRRENGIKMSLMMNLEFCQIHLDFCRYIGISSGRQQRTLLYRQNTCDLPTEYGEELRVSDPKLRNFRLAWLN